MEGIVYVELDALPDAPTILVVDQWGAYLSKHSERLQVRVKGATVQEAPLMHLRQVIMAAKGASISTEAIRECCERGIPISFVSRSGTPYARLDSPALLGTVRTRREQLLAYTDTRGLTFVQASISAKLQNQQNLLRYMAKYRKAEAREVFLLANEAAIEIAHLANRVMSLEGSCIDECRTPLMNLEAQAARRYWDAVGSLLLKVDEWPGRVHRGADDPVNACLNYGYGVLYGQIEAALLLAGLDPYAGFLHTDRSGKPSMAFDLIEEFRQPVVDRTVFALFNRGEGIHMEDHRLDDASRRLLAERVLARLDTAEPYRGKRQKLRAVMALQAQRLAGLVRGEGEYTGYVMRW